MKLLFLNYEFPPLGGGAAYASFAMARELVHLGHRVEFLTAGVPGGAAEEELDGVRVHRVFPYRRGVHDVGMGGAVSFLCAAARQLPALARAGNFDAYHYYFGLPTGLLSLVPGAHRKRPYVVSLRGSDVPGYDPSLDRWHRALMPLTRRIWGNAHRVVANSDGLRQLALASVPTRRIDVVLNGISVLPEAPGCQTASPGIRALTVCRLIERKGLDTLIEAVATVRAHGVPLSLDIAGEGPCRDALAQCVTHHGISDAVHFHGFVDHEQLARLHAQAHLFVLPSRAESCSMALLEAIGAALPVVATRVGGTPELIEHDRNGILVPADDKAALAAAIEALANEPARRRRYAAANRALAASRFSWRRVAERYQEIFEGAIASTPASTRSTPAVVVPEARFGISQR